MFRRATSLPARPSIPNKEEILEDLGDALPDDVIFEYSNENIKNGVKQPINLYEDGDLTEEKDKEPSCEKVELFLHKINCLKCNMTNLKEQKTNLKTLKENLVQDMNRIKNELKAKPPLP